MQFAGQVLDRGIDQRVGLLALGFMTPES